MLKQLEGVTPQSSDYKKVKYLYGPVAIAFASTKTGSWRIMRPEVDHNQCTRCGTCAKYCPLDIIDVDKESKVQSVTMNLDYCKGCGICANVCPRKCIKMVSERGER
ncbi:pyruvate synthase subunit PorD [Moorella thermoacetica]|uniref:4Fe-4S binding protein n=1 Tax=Neomoorella thermoacetica TaxID=1525 RepID=UPI00069DB0EC|nr:4Fe-4S binding protein [Moorella thermoacetica]AKX93120.1 pyruvate synthase subunit PorD [Moorella thermoacetica]